MKLMKLKLSVSLILEGPEATFFLMSGNFNKIEGFFKSLSLK